MPLKPGAHDCKANIFLLNNYYSMWTYICICKFLGVLAGIFENMIIFCKRTNGRPKKFQRCPQSRKKHTKITPIPSDGLFKKIMEDVVTARDFLEYYLPDDFKKLIDLYEKWKKY